MWCSRGWEGAEVRPLTNQSTKPNTTYAPAAFSMLSSVTQLASATCTFSCSTSLTLSTLFITAASLSTSSRLSYLPMHVREGEYG